MPGLHYSAVPPLASLLLMLFSLLFHAIGRGSIARRVAVYGLLLAAASFPIYALFFIALDFSLREVATHTSTGMPVWLRLAASWSGGGSSLLLFASVYSIGVLYLARSHRGRGFEALAVSVALLAILSAFMLGAFEPMGKASGGTGINPLLESVWILVHPPSTFGGYALLLASSIALASGARHGRGLFLIGWGLLTAGIVLGGYWSYTTLGWGGYWAWDPVETGELLVWLSSTALVHMYGALSSAIGYFSMLVASSVLLSMFVTRTGLSPLHGFAAPNIGAAILLALSVSMLAWFIYKLASTRIPGVREAASILLGMHRSSMELAGVTAAFAVLLIAALFLYGTLLVPSIVVALGGDASVPSMEEGARYFNRVLYPLMLASMALYVYAFLGDIVGFRGFLVVLASAIILSIVLSAALLTGRLSVAPLSALETQAMIAVALPLVSAALLSVIARMVADVSRYKGFSPAPILRRLIHAGMTLTLAGILLSGPYSFNDSYFEVIELKPGESARIGDVEISLGGYEYGVQDSIVDVYNPYVETAATYYIAWMSLNGLGRTAAPLVEALKGFKEAMEGDRELASTVNALLSIHGSPVQASLRARVELYKGNMVWGNTTRLYGPGEAIINVNATIFVEPSLEESGKGGIEKSVVYLALRGSIDLSVQGIGKIGGRDLGGHEFYYIQVSGDPPAIRVGGSGPLILVTSLEAYKLAPPETDRVNTSTLVVYLNGYLVVNGSRHKIPLEHGSGLYYFLEYALPGRSPLLKSLVDTGMGDLLLDNETVSAIVRPRPGHIAVPSRLPEGSYLRLELSVKRHGGLSEVVESMIRFEVNGEVQGIHGLVPAVTLIDYGLGDIYVAASPPFISGSRGSYHELIVYYLAELMKEYPRPKALAVASLLASGYNIESVSESQHPSGIDVVQAAIIDLYSLAHTYTNSSPAIEAQGVTLRVKIVPLTDLVWYGSALMIVSSIILGSLYERARVPGSTRQALLTPSSPKRYVGGYKGGRD